jgi:hypothetical protein
MKTAVVYALAFATPAYMLGLALWDWLRSGDHEKAGRQLGGWR